jgi:hypothetical protein
MKNRRTLLILGGAFALLLLVVILQGTGINAGRVTRLVSGAPTPTTDPFSGMPRVLTDFTVLDIQAVRIGSPNTGDSLLISRTAEGTWEAPESDGDLDAETATLIARTMVLLPFFDTFPLPPEEELAQFGFVRQNPRAVTVEILLVDGTTHALFFGGLTPNEDAFYTVVDERETVYLVEPRAVEFLRLQLRHPPVNLTSE